MNEEEFLKKMILEQNESYSAIGKILGISGNAVNKYYIQFRLHRHDHRIEVL